MASMTVDLPEPVGPTNAKYSALEKSMVVVSRNPTSMPKSFASVSRMTSFCTSP